MAEDGPPAPALEERVLDASRASAPHRPPRRAAGGRGPRVLVPASRFAGARSRSRLVLGLNGGDERRPPGFKVALQPVAGKTASGRARARERRRRHHVRLWVNSLPRDPGDRLRGPLRRAGLDAPAPARSAPTHTAAPMSSSTPRPEAASTTRSAVVRRTPVELRRTSCEAPEPVTRSTPHDPHPRDPRERRSRSRSPAAAVIRLRRAADGGSSGTSAARAADRAEAVSRSPSRRRRADGSLKFDKTTLDAKAGTVTINYDNPSTTPHAVEIEGNGVEEKSDTITGGKTSVTADLKPGTYDVLLPGRRPPRRRAWRARSRSSERPRHALGAEVEDRARGRAPRTARRAISPSGPNGSA